LVLAAHAGAQSGYAADTTAFGKVIEAGRLENTSIREASGLARSHLMADRLWTLNDGGSSPELYAHDLSGQTEGTVRVVGARNVDWEDLASFESRGRAWLLIADIGDNNSRRDHCTLYVVEEPDPGEQERSRTQVDRVIHFRYPEGARDSEAAAVDAINERILLLSKRSIPAMLYELPLYPEDAHAIVIAKRLGAVDSLPQPTGQDLQRALPEKSWHWQPTAADIAADGRSAAILTYRAAYFYTRDPEESWIETFRREPSRLDLDSARLAESIAISPDGMAIFVTLEGRRPPLLRFSRDSLKNQERQ